MYGTEDATPEKSLRLSAFVSGVFHMLRELTVDEENYYQKAHDHLLNHDEAVSLIEIVRRNLDAFEQCVNELSQVVPSPTKRGALSREAKTDVNRHFLNFLSAVRQFLDHTETRLKRDYDDKPEMYETFRKRTVKAFEDVFAYRMLYKLRNYSQHCGAPIGVVEYESKVVGNAGTVHTLHLLLDAQYLLRTGGDVWGPVKADLKKIKSKFPVDPLPRKMLKELEAIWNVVRQAEKAHLKASAEVVLATIKEIAPPYVNPAVVRCWHRKKGMTIQFVNPPIDTMTWLGDHPFREIL